MKKKILIADDADIMVTLGKVLFNREGCEVLTATDGSEALEICQSAKPDLALIDLRMPGLDGVAIMEKLKEDPETAGIPVVVFSGSVQPEDQDRCRAAGAVDYLSKPLQLDQVLRKTAVLLGIPVRRHVRVPVSIAVAADDDSGGFQAESRNISVSGISFATDASLGLDASVALSFKLPGQDQVLEPQGKVVREIPPLPDRGYGIEFVEPTDALRAAIEDFVYVSEKQGQDAE